MVQTSVIGYCVAECKFEESKNMALCACVYVLGHQIAQMLVISFKQVSLEITTRSPYFL